MPGTWWTRFTIVVAVTLWAIWSLIPTVLGKSVQDKLAAEAEAATSARPAKMPTKPPWKTSTGG
jgi:hypothetical protein